jgi:hypothetical protein
MNSSVTNSHYDCTIMTPPAKARQIDIIFPCSHAAVAPPNGPKQAVAVSWCSSAVRLVA